MKPQNEFAKMIPEHECDQDIITSVPAYDSYTVFPNKYGAWIQGAQWERNRQKNLPSRELLTVEFRYTDKRQDENDVAYLSKKITIGIYDTIEQAVKAGNEVLNVLSKTFEIRKDDRFKMNGLFGFPDRLVSNCCYPTKGIQYFAKIEKLVTQNIEEVISEAFVAAERYREFIERKEMP